MKGTTTISIEEYAANSEEILERVNKGEKIAIVDGELRAVLVPSKFSYLSDKVSQTP
jgi:antitoxin (DNA-binding transcriptional repressor) of toxin-antitoxin stability system|tara:strand:- start:228 stop:398 length:171 start_codon:yes stop_codon:yes gene_type:complete